MTHRHRNKSFLYSRMFTAATEAAISPMFQLRCIVCGPSRVCPTGRDWDWEEPPWLARICHLADLNSLNLLLPPSSMNYGQTTPSWEQTSLISSLPSWQNQIYLN
jgi:hypothetical protein